MADRKQTEGHAVFSPAGNLVVNTISTECSRLRGGNGYQAIRSAVRMLNPLRQDGIEAMWESMERQGFTVERVIITRCEEADKEDSDE